MPSSGQASSEGLSASSDSSTRHRTSTVADQLFAVVSDVIVGLGVCRGLAPRFKVRLAALHRATPLDECVCLRRGIIDGAVGVHGLPYGGGTATVDTIESEDGVERAGVHICRVTLRAFPDDSVIGASVVVNGVVNTLSRAACLY